MAAGRRRGKGRGARALPALACLARAGAEAAWDQDAFGAQLRAWASAWEQEPRAVDGGAGDAEELPPARAEVVASVRAAVGSVSFKDATKYAGWAADFQRSPGGGTYAVAAVLAEAVALLPDCLAELRSRAEVQTRCPQKWYKIAIQKLLSLDDRAGAERAWRRATGLAPGANAGAPPDGAAAAIPWPSVLQTPTIWVRGLRSEPFWDCHSAWPFVRTLEAQADRILSEARTAAPRLTTAYPYLFAQGSWQNFFIFRGQAWNTEVCAAMPRTCHLLIPEIPTKPTLPFVVPNNEEIVLFRSEPGAFVGPHSGATNGQVNIHLTLTGGEGVFLRVGEERRELRAGRALCFQDSFVHSLEHRCEAASDGAAGRGCAERISLVVRVFHPDFTAAHYGNAKRTDAVDNLSSWHEGQALRHELDRLREQYRRLADLQEDFWLRVQEEERPCAAPEPTEAELRKAQRLFAFLSAPFGAPASGAAAGQPPRALGEEASHADKEPVDAIVVLSNWYDRLTKVQKVLELATQHRSAPIVLIGGRGRLSSIRAAELDGEAHVTLARLLVLLEIPGELPAISTDRVVAISCNECPTAELRRRCGCVGNTGFNADRFLDWAAVSLPPLPERRRRVVFVEESFLVRRVTATVLGRLSGAFGHRHTLATMEVSVVDARGLPGEDGLQQVMAAHSEMPGGVLHLMAGEVLRLEEYARGIKMQPRAEASEGSKLEAVQALFPRAFFLAGAEAAVAAARDAVGSNGTAAAPELQAAWDPAGEAEEQALLATARQLDEQWAAPMRRVSADRRIFWRCVAPRDTEGPLWAREISEAPGEAWWYWKCPRGEVCTA